ncbi:hypothetical protein KL918_001017 [Ogataea parapolymorpha]|nr:hypothetical protein KL918_001017 [Ogataea parapolymorpha]
MWRISRFCGCPRYRTACQRLEDALNNSAEIPAYSRGSEPAERQVRDATEPRASCLLIDPKLCSVTQYGRASVHDRQDLHVLY